MKLRNAKVFVRCDAAGAPVSDGGRVEIRYKPADGRAYQAGVRNLVAIADAKVFPDSHCKEAAPVETKGAGAVKKSGTKNVKGSAKTPPHEAGAIIVYADGACSGNPGPAGAGVVIEDDGVRIELSEYLGQGTNNIGELTGILRAAERLERETKPIRIYTDSQYSIGVLTKGWKAKKNVELIAEVKAALGKLADVHLYYVKGHAGIELNEVADSLAREAVDNRASRGWE